MDTTLIAALLSTLLASSIAIARYLANRIDRQGERIDRAEERFHDRHVELLKMLRGTEQRFHDRHLELLEEIREQFRDNEERAHERHVELLRSSAVFGERIARIEGRLDLQEEAA